MTSVTTERAWPRGQTGAALGPPVPPDRPLKALGAFAGP